MTLREGKLFSLYLQNVKVIEGVLPNPSKLAGGDVGPWSPGRWGLGAGDPALLGLSARVPCGSCLMNACVNTGTFSVALLQPLPPETLAKRAFPLSPFQRNVLSCVDEYCVCSRI